MNHPHLVPPLQGWRDFMDSDSRGFTPGYHMTGLQPGRGMRLKKIPPASPPSG